MVQKKDDCQSMTPRENILRIILVNLVMVYTLTNFKDKHGKKKNIHNTVEYTFGTLRF
jgi:hypothetical protein